MSLSAIIDHVLKLPRPAKRLIALSLDAVVCVVSVWLAFYLRLGYWSHPAGAPAHPSLASIAIALPIFVSFGLYRAIFRYADSEALGAIIRAVALYALPFILIYTVIGIDGTPRTVGIIQPILLLVMIIVSRGLAKFFFGETYMQFWKSPDGPRVLIYGAGTAGRELASAIGSSKDMQLVGFIDDNPNLWRSTMFGVPIAAPQDVGEMVEKRAVTEILLAIPSATRTRRTEILAQMRELGVHVLTLPSVSEITRGTVSVSDLRDLDIEDLLGRAPIPPDENLLRKNIAGKTVMVTGAGGSIGSELCRQIAREGPAQLLLVDLSEFNLYAIHKELSLLSDESEERGDGPLSLVPLLASVHDAKRMEAIVSTWGPDTIYHAAAYKHVPLVEHNPVDGIRNNVVGTLTVARLAKQYGTSNFVLISTDKAVRPTNVMGTTKRLAEMTLQALQSEGGETCFSMVRFGNVLESSGSVVPLFREQISSGGPLTITHADITRYFMTIPEAAQLVLQAGAMAQGGDVFLLDMGEPVRIVDLGRNMIELSGLSVRDAANPDGDIEIRIVGLRPGEKLYEELLIGDNPAPSQHPRIMRSNEPYRPWPELKSHLEELEAALGEGDAATARNLLQSVVPEYAPTTNLADLVSEARSRAWSKPDSATLT